MGENRNDMKQLREYTKEELIRMLNEVGILATGRLAGETEKVTESALGVRVDPLRQYKPVHCGW